MGMLRTKIEEALAKKKLTLTKRPSRMWLLEMIKKLKITSQSIMKDRERLRNKTILGRFYFFFYDPKTKEKMKYYDKFPLVIPIFMYPDGFLGLNFHYVYPLVRLKLLSKLMLYASNHRLDERTRIRLSYPIIKETSSLFRATPCIKRYLWSHVRSRFMELESADWKMAMTLPVQQFMKEKATTVWAESEEKAQDYHESHE